MNDCLHSALHLQAACRRCAAACRAAWARLDDGDAGPGAGGAAGRVPGQEGGGEWGIAQHRGPTQRAPRQRCTRQGASEKKRKKR